LVSNIGFDWKVIMSISQPTDAIDNCPEYLIRLPTLYKIAKEYNLVLESRDPFYTIFEKNYSKHGEVFKRMAGITIDEWRHTVPQDQWEVCSIYDSLVFMKE
jgi:hypothetical protein